MTFQKGHTAWNKGKKRTVKVEKEPKLDIDLDDPSQQPIEYAPEPNFAKKEGFFTRLFSFFR